MQEEIINLLKSSDLSKENIQTYSISEFVALIKVFNDVGQLINADSIKDQILKRLIKQYGSENQLV
jgi:hypothetical protein